MASILKYRVCSKCTIFFIVVYFGKLLERIVDGGDGGV